MSLPKTFACAEGIPVEPERCGRLQGLGPGMGTSAAIVAAQPWSLCHAAVLIGCAR
jgi:hypothetical protein